MLAVLHSLEFTSEVQRHRNKLSKPAAVALGASIKSAREKLGLSQGEFARRIGVSQQKISEWERGLRLRQVITAWRLADALSEVGSDTDPMPRGS